MRNYEHVLDQGDLAYDAKALRLMLVDLENCQCNLTDPDVKCTCASQNNRLFDMDARERKWAAAKLLEPIETGIGDLLSDLDLQEVLAVLMEYWAVTVQVSAELPIDRCQRMVLQFRNTRAFVCKAWKMSDPSE